MLASLEHELMRLRALCTLELQDDLLSRFDFLVKHGLSLSTITRLLSVVTTLS